MISDINIWGYDFEVYSKIGWWCVTFINYENEDNIVTIINNREELLDFYNNYKNDIIIGYNSRQYDVWILKAILNGQDPSYVSDQLFKHNKKGYQVVDNHWKYPVNNYDCILLNKSLKQLEGFMGDDIQETQVPFDIDRPLTEEEVEQIVGYNVHDVKECLKVFRFNKSDFDAHLGLISMYNLEMDMFNKTKAQLSAHVLGAVKNQAFDDEFEITIPSNLRMPKKYQHVVEWFQNPKNMSYKLPLKSESNRDSRQLVTTIANIPHYIGFGGIHGSQDNIVREGIIVNCDVASLYPSLMINEGYHSRNLINPEEFKRIRDSRIELKAKGDKRQLPLKIAINSAYGILKDIYSPCYDPLMSNNVCIAGQLFLIELTARIEDLCEILQVNTDGIFLLAKDMETVKQIQDIAKEWEERNNLVLEWNVYENARLIQKDVNNYLLVDKDDGKIKERKGGYVKKLSPIDYDLPIINKALIKYLAYDIPVEETINNETNLIEFQKIIKLTNLYKGVVYGDAQSVKMEIGNKVVDRNIVKNGVELKEKVHRVFASTRDSDKGIFKIKVEKGQESYEKIAYTPDKCFIYNDSLDVDWYFDEEDREYKYTTCKQIPDYLDKQYYIDLANERIKHFLEPVEEKIDDTPNILYKCMCESDTFYDFLKLCNENKITNRVLKDYIIADCCFKYGKTQKLLKFKKYFDYLYNKKRFTVRNIENKIQDENMLKIITSYAELSNTGKSYINFNYKQALLDVFNALPNEHIHPYQIMKMQIEKFNDVRYVHDTPHDNRWFVLNTRNVIAPNLIIYNMKTGETQYRKVNKDVFNILPLQDGDIIDILDSKLEYGKEIIGKSSDGVNILGENKNKVYDVITKYEIIFRDYKSPNSKLATSIVEMED